MDHAQKETLDVSVQMPDSEVDYQEAVLPPQEFEKAFLLTKKYNGALPCNAAALFYPIATPF